RAVRAASGLLATTRQSADALRAVGSQAGSQAHVSWIYNGFDPNDFAGRAVAAEPRVGPFRLVFVGTLWTLTSVEPMVEAIRVFCRVTRAWAPDLERVVAGRRTPHQQDLIAGLKRLPCRLVEQPYIEHAAAVDLMCGADALCLLLSDLPGAGRVVPAKL